MCSSDLVEAHGTGTSLGDPIEIAALSAAFRAHTPDAQFCAIGSVKSNIGHLEATAGMAALAKVVLQFEKRQIAPSLHAETVNPHIDFDSSPFYLQRSLGEWDTTPRVAGISSFGAGGSNAHLVVEGYDIPRVESSEAQKPAGQLILLSARNLERLRFYAARLARHLALSDLGEPDEFRRLARVAFTLQAGREALEQRLALWVKSTPELIQKLATFAEKGEGEEILLGRAGDFGTEFNDLFSGESGAAFLGELVRNPNRLARFWVRGAKIDWAAAAAQRITRIHLPGYPLDRKSVV